MNDFCSVPGWRHLAARPRCRAQPRPPGCRKTERLISSSSRARPGFPPRGGSSRISPPEKDCSRAEESETMSAENRCQRSCASVRTGEQKMRSHWREKNTRRNDGRTCQGALQACGRWRPRGRRSLRSDACVRPRKGKETKQVERRMRPGERGWMLMQSWKTVLPSATQSTHVFSYLYKGGQDLPARNRRTGENA